VSRDKTLTCLRQSQKIDFVCAWLRYRRLALMARRRGAGCPQRARYHGLTRAMEVGRFCPQVGAHLSRCARILGIKAEPNLNAENFSIIVVGDVLKNQERDHEHGHSGRDKKATRARLTDPPCPAIAPISRQSPTGKQMSVV